LSIYTAIFAPTVVAVILILAADLALGMRDLPNAALFRTAEIAILVAYLIFAGMLRYPALLMVAWVPVSLVLIVAYLALSAAQATAIAVGLEEWGIGSRWRAHLCALLAYLPVVGGAFAVWGAALGWRWTTGASLMRFFGPLAAILAPLLVFFGYARLREAGILA
jgi:hypothetical protein